MHMGVFFTAFSRRAAIENIRLPSAVTDGNYPLSAASACASLLGLTGFTK